MGDYYGHASQTTKASSDGAPVRSGPSITSGLDQGKIFVGGLSWQTNEESLRWHFQQFGAVASVEVMRDRVTGDPRGFAFVVFADPQTVELVMQEGRHEINHKVVDVKRAQARGVAPPSIHQAHGASQASSDPSNRAEGGGGASDTTKGLTPEQLQTKVFVGGLPHSVDNDELKRIFEEFGPVVDAIVMVDQASGRSRGFGFVTFEPGSNGAHKAIEVQPIPIQGRNVEVKLATPKEDQRKHSAAGGGGGGSGGLANSRFMGLRAGIASNSSGKYSGLAVAYARNGWKAGYGSKAFGAMGWQVAGWADGGPAPSRAGFSFDMLRPGILNQDSKSLDPTSPPPTKRARH